MAQLLRSPGEADHEFSVAERRRRIELAVLLVTVLGLGVGVLLTAPRADAKQKFMSWFAEAYPAAAGTPLDSCVLCHTDPAHPREENLNNYGEDWEDGDFGDKEYLAPNLVNRDSDGDGVPNGQEIQQLSLPGDPSSSTAPTTTTTVPGTRPDGQALYAARCAGCHEPRGDLVGTGLGRSQFISITINGQGAMGPQANLSDEQVGAIWDYVTGATPATTTTTLPGATTTTTTPLSGAGVWAQQCAACHGANGGNVVPTSSSRSQLVSIITNGVGIMRGFPELGTAQIGNVADYLLGFGAPTTTTTLPGATTITTTPRSGSVVYAASCAVCHGSDGGNLRGHTLTRSGVVAITTNGVGTMGGDAGRLSTAEIDNVAQYVFSLGAGSGVTTTTAPPGSPISGSTLYMQNCSGCHGLHGEGGLGGAVAGTSLSRSAIISLTEAGTNGMPGYGSQLSAVEIAAVADHILGMGGAGDPGGAADGGTVDDVNSGNNPVVSSALAPGHALYGQFCAACHGADGEGGSGGPVAGIEMSAAELEEIIRNGTSSMPGFATRLSDAEVEALVAYSEAVASGSTLALADATTTTTTPADETSGSDDARTVFAADLPDPVGGDGLPVTIIVAIVGGLLVAGGAAFFWMRALRDLVT